MNTAAIASLHQHLLAAGGECVGAGGTDDAGTHDDGVGVQAQVRIPQR